MNGVHRRSMKRTRGWTLRNQEIFYWFICSNANLINSKAKSVLLLRGGAYRLSTRREKHFSQHLRFVIQVKDYCKEASRMPQLKEDSWFLQKKLITVSRCKMANRLLLGRSVVIKRFEPVHIPKPCLGTLHARHLHTSLRSQSCVDQSLSLPEPSSLRTQLSHSGPARTTRMLLGCAAMLRKSFCSRRHPGSGGGVETSRSWLAGVPYR
jgi:hypothetical protein